MNKVRTRKIRVEEIRVKDLYKFACDIPSGSEGNDLVPITRQRALAQVHNPYADDNDVGLLVAYARDRCVGYLGVLPGLLRCGSSFSKVYWGSTWFVLPEFRKTLAGLSLSRHFKRVLPEIVFINLSKEAQRIIKYLGARELGAFKYYIVDIKRMNAVFKKAFYGMLLRCQKRYLKNISYREVSEIHEADTRRAEYNSASAEFYRGHEIINWMLNYKWIVESGKGEDGSADYLFSNVRDLFKYIALKVYSSDGKDYKGFLVLSVSSANSETILKILDFYFLDQADYKYIVFLAFKYAGTYRADFIHLPDSLFSHIKKNILVRFLAHEKRWICLGYPWNRNSPLANFFYSIRLSYCDGDTAFT